MTDEAEIKERYFQLRLTEKQRAIMEKQAKKRGLSKSKYILYLIEQDEKIDRVIEEHGTSQTNNPPIRVYKDSDLNRLIWHLGHWGNNLNQASTALNRLANGNVFSDAKSATILKKVEKLLTESHEAVIKMKDVVYTLKEEQHIVLNDRNR